GAVCLRIMADGGSAMAAIVEGDDTKAGLDQRLHPAGRDPVHLHVRGKTMNQQHWRSAADILTGKTEPCIVEKLRPAHDPSIISGRTSAQTCPQWLAPLPFPWLVRPAGSGRRVAAATGR